MGRGTHFGNLIIWEAEGSLSYTGLVVVGSRMTLRMKKKIKR